jgi:proline dehydrogenase
MNIINDIITKTIPFLPKKIVKIIADKYVAGQTPKEALEIIQSLNLKKYDITIDLLGEHLSDIKEINEVTNTYINLLDEINKKSLSSNISVKPTHIGLDLGIEEFYKNALKLVRKAKDLNNFIRFDMEHSDTTNETIDVFKRIYKNYKNTGTVFQAYLKRSFNDIDSMEEKINFRLCKGIYNENSNIAYQDKQKINENYLRIAELAFKKEHYIGLATHDLDLIKQLYLLIEKYNVPITNFEFQVLYGVPMHGWLQKHLDNNYKVRIYLPYGPQWYEYSIRRLKENPNIARYVAKSIFSNRAY